MKIFLNCMFVLTASLSVLFCNPPEEPPKEKPPVIITAFNPPEQHDYSAAINEVLQQDATFAPNANGDNAIVAAGMRQIDLSECPNDFSQAYVNHIHAWERAADIQKALSMLRSDKNVQGTVFYTILQKIFGSESNALDDALEQEEALTQAQAVVNQQIKATFDQVESIAAGYGATLPN